MKDILKYNYHKDFKKFSLENATKVIGHPLCLNAKSFFDKISKIFSVLLNFE